MTKFESFIFRLAPIRFLFKVAARIKLPGFEGFTLAQAAVFFYRELRNTNLNMRVAAVTYNFLMAIPPTLLFLFTLVPYLPLEGVQETILNILRLIVPNQGLYESIEHVIVDFMTREQRGLLSFGILLTLFYSSNGIVGLMRSFDRSLKYYKQRTNFQRRWTAIKLTLMLILMVVVSLAVLIVQTQVLNSWLEHVFGGLATVKFLSVVILALVVFCAISMIYTYGPSLTHRFKFISPGSVCATLALTLITLGFSYVVSNFLHYNQVYGSIGTLIAFLLWLYLNTFVILLGYELNVSILVGKMDRDQAFRYEKKD